MSAKTKCCQHGISASRESNLKKIQRRHYAKWVNHVIETCDMWCAMFELCQYSIPGTHLTHSGPIIRSHPPGWKEIESGAIWKKVFNFMVWQLCTRTRMTRREVLSVIRTKLSPEWHSHSSHSVWDHRMWWLKMLLMIYCKFAFYDMWAGHIIWPMSDKMISMGTFR